jgi:hypothetical protein
MRWPRRRRLAARLSVFETRVVTGRIRRILVYETWYARRCDAARQNCTAPGTDTVQHSSFGHVRLSFTLVRSGGRDATPELSAVSMPPSAIGQASLTSRLRRRID